LERQLAVDIDRSPEREGCLVRRAAEATAPGLHVALAADGDRRLPGVDDLDRQRIEDLLRLPGATPRRLGPERQPEDRDEAHGAGMVERVPLVVGREGAIVEGARAAAPGDRGGAVVELDPDITGHDLLRGR